MSDSRKVLQHNLSQLLEKINATNLVARLNQAYEEQDSRQEQNLSIDQQITDTITRDYLVVNRMVSLLTQIKDELTHFEKEEPAIWNDPHLANMYVEKISSLVALITHASTPIKDTALAEYVNQLKRFANPTLVLTYQRNLDEIAEALEERYSETKDYLHRLQPENDKLFHALCGEIEFYHALGPIYLESLQAAISNELSAAASDDVMIKHFFYFNADRTHEKPSTDEIIAKKLFLTFHCPSGLEGNFTWGLDEANNTLRSQPFQEDVKDIVSLMSVKSLRLGLLPSAELFSIEKSNLENGNPVQIIVIDLKKMNEAIRSSLLTKDYLSSTELDSVVLRQVQKIHKKNNAHWETYYGMTYQNLTYGSKVEVETIIKQMKERDASFGLVSPEIDPYEVHFIPGDPDQYQIQINLALYKQLLDPKTNLPLLSVYLLHDTLTQVEQLAPMSLLQQLSYLLKKMTESSLLTALENQLVESKDDTVLDYDSFILQQLILTLKDILQFSPDEWGQQQEDNAYNKIAQLSALIEASPKTKNPTLRKFVAEFSRYANPDHVSIYQRNLPPIAETLRATQYQLQQLQLSSLSQESASLCEMINAEITHYQQRGPIYLKELQDRFANALAIISCDVAKDYLAHYFPRFSPLKTDGPTDVNSLNKSIIKNIYSHFTTWTLRKSEVKDDAPSLLFLKHDFVSMREVQKTKEQMIAAFQRMHPGKDFSDLFIIESNSNQSLFNLGVNIMGYEALLGIPTQSAEETSILIKKDLAEVGIDFMWQQDPTGSVLVSQPIQHAENIISLMTLQSLRAGLLPVPQLFSIQEETLGNGEKIKRIVVNLQNVDEAINKSRALGEKFSSSEELDAVVLNHAQSLHQAKLSSGQIPPWHMTTDNHRTYQNIAYPRDVALDAITKMRYLDAEMGLFSAEGDADPYSIQAKSTDPEKYTIHIDLERYKKLLAPQPNLSLASMKLVHDTLVQVKHFADPVSFFQQSIFDLTSKMNASPLLARLEEERAPYGMTEESDLAAQKTERDYFILRNIVVLLQDINAENSLNADLYEKYIDAISRIIALIQASPPTENTMLARFTLQFSELANPDLVKTYQHNLADIDQMLKSKQAEWEKLKSESKAEPLFSLYTMACKATQHYQDLGPVYLQEFQNEIIHALRIASYSNSEAEHYLNFYACRDHTRKLDVFRAANESIIRNALPMLHWQKSARENELVSNPCDAPKNTVALMTVQSLRMGLLPVDGLFSIRDHVIAIDLQKMEQATQIPLQEDYLSSPVLTSVVENHVQSFHAMADKRGQKVVWQKADAYLCHQTIDEATALFIVNQMKQRDADIGLVSSTINPYTIRPINQGKYQIQVNLQSYTQLLAPVTNPTLARMKSMHDTLLQVENLATQPLIVRTSAAPSYSVADEKSDCNTLQALAAQLAPIPSLAVQEEKHPLREQSIPAQAPHSLFFASMVAPAKKSIATEEKVTTDPENLRLKLLEWYKMQMDAIQQDLPKKYIHFFSDTAALIKLVNEILQSKSTAYTQLVEITDLLLNRVKKFIKKDYPNNFNAELKNTKKHHGARMVIGVLQKLFVIVQENEQSFGNLKDMISESSLLKNVSACDLSQYQTLQDKIKQPLNQTSLMQTIKAGRVD